MKEILPTLLWALMFVALYIAQMTESKKREKQFQQTINNLIKSIREAERSNKDGVDHSKEQKAIEIIAESIAPIIGTENAQRIINVIEEKEEL